MSATHKIIIVTDSYLLSTGLESLALEISGLLVDAVFPGSEKKLCVKIADRKPDYLIIDPCAAGLNLVKIINELHEEPDLKLIGLVNSDTPANIASHFDFVLNIEGSKIELVEALKKAVGNIDSSQKSENALSKREIEILRELALGSTNQEIAHNLFLSVHTVTTHRKKITRKLGIKTVSGLTVYALINDIVDIREVERRS